MDILRAQENAKDLDWKNGRAYFLTSTGVRCKWLDPFLGLFQIVGQEGFAMVSQVSVDIVAQWEEPAQEEGKK